ncbi:hypothetical protein SAMN05421825_3062 [Epilithonimonas hungarica]|uniref:Cytochrome B n=1 Tax=Epilithonimonas hungarica TaxID=454006 RepID=A0A1G7SRW4_9FLAO|nr:hypothetical protein SAMN05421825_3062 [Epilithonimonas hungarica]
MYILTKNLHGIFAYISLILLIFAVIYAIYGLLRRTDYGKPARIISMLALSGVHMQIVIGLVLYFLSPLGSSNVSREMMKNSTSRFYALEHPFMMLIGIALITIGYVRAKKASEKKRKFLSIAIFYAIGLLCLLSRMP